MKKTFITLSLLLAALMSQAQQQLPQWANKLVSMNPGLIDSVRLIPFTQPKPGDYGYEENMEIDAAKLPTSTYMVYYHQPVQHSNPTGEQFPLRATISVFKDADVTKAANHVYCGGYAIEDWWTKNPDLMLYGLKNDNMTEIAFRYHGNLICPEFRYFQYSSPVQCYNKLDGLTSEEAAQDFHNLINALKKVFKGKWAMTGASKGGTATLLQHAFYPEDADIFVPYCAPFFNSDRDTNMQQYWLNNGWNKSYRDMFMAVRKTAVYRQEQIYPIFYKMAKTTGLSDNNIYARYLENIAGFGFSEHTDLDTTDINRIMAFNLQAMDKCGIKDYNDTVYAVMLYYCRFELKELESWYPWLKGSGNMQAPASRLTCTAPRPISITEAQWWGNEAIGKREQTYEYMSKTELGYYDLCFDGIVTPEEAPAWNAEYKKYVGNLRDFYSPWFAQINYKSDIYNRAVTTTKNATQPIIFIYGEDDAWTGAAMRDEYINGSNVQKFVISGQNHSVSFSSNAEPAKCNAIRATLDGIFGTPQGVEQTLSPAQRTNSGKLVMLNGQIYVSVGDQLFTLQGQRVSTK